MTKNEAIKIFKREILPQVLDEYGEDRVAIREAWDDFVVDLYKDSGLITAKQYETWILSPL